MGTGRTAFITGITGQDGPVLAAFLLARGYVVHGMRQYCATDDTQNLSHILQHPQFHIHTGDMSDGGSLARLLRECRPDEVYNLAAQSHVHASFDAPDATMQINALGVVRLLEAIRFSGNAKNIRFYQASSSEMFGNAAAPQNETTPFEPCSPYAVSKLAAYWMVRNYRDAYGLFACNGILFNHEGVSRGGQFVTQKIAHGVADIVTHKNAPPIVLGNLNSKRDWGDTRDYVRGMWMMLQHDRADDYVLATGRAYSVRDFVNEAFSAGQIKLNWSGCGVDETAHCAQTGRLLVRVDPALFRPVDVVNLMGDATKARDVLGWVPEYDFKSLVHDMVRGAMAHKNVGADYDAVIAV